MRMSPADIDARPQEPAFPGVPSCLGIGGGIGGYSIAALGRAAALGEAGMGRYGQVWAGMGRYGQVWAGMGRYGGRYGGYIVSPL
jgi:hypothetical protein